MAVLIVATGRSVIFNSSLRPTCPLLLEQQSALDLYIYSFMARCFFAGSVLLCSVYNINEVFVIAAGELGREGCQKLQV